MIQTIKTIILMLCLSATFLVAAIPNEDTVRNFIGMKFKRIPAGSYMRGFDGKQLTGSVAYNNITNGFYNEYPRHAVKISTDFYMGVYEVLRKEYNRSDPSAKPAAAISWAKADSFCQWLTTNDPNGWSYRLPTEAEWEYCCRAGTTSWFSTGDTITSAAANIIPGWGSRVTPVTGGSYAPNAWGLYDMHGNAEEWCLDWLAQYPAGVDTLVNPAGPQNGKLRVIRSFGHYLIYVRSSARGALPVDMRTSSPDRLGFRVVISKLTKDSLYYYPNPDTLQNYQKRVATTRPLPSTSVTGETYVNSEGLTFKRVRLLSTGYPMQRDSVIYVSNLPVSSDSGNSRMLASLYATRLSATNGVLYRIANRYELLSHGEINGSGFYLTLLPDIAYTSTSKHPDLTSFVSRKAGYIPTPLPAIGGPVFHKCNHNSFIGEAPNGDILSSWYSGTTEDCEEQVTAVSRLRLGENKYDSLVSQAVDFPGNTDYTDVWHDNRRGELLNFHSASYSMSGTWLRKSSDNGVNWSDWKWAFNSTAGKSLFYYGWDTLIDLNESGRVIMSTDNGETWKNGAANAGSGYHSSGFPLDNGVIMAFQRGATVINDSGKATMLCATTTNLGTSWTPQVTPFKPPSIGQYDVALKLHSGRLLMVTAGASGVCIAESIDSARTWFCRRKLTGLMSGYKDAVQGRDGIIHVQGTIGSGQGMNGNLPQVSFSEQWLREGSCLDVAEWGINTPSSISPCPYEDTIKTPVYSEMVTKLSQVIGLAASPNPFNPSVKLMMTSQLIKGLTLQIFDCSGKMVEDLSTAARENGTIVWQPINKPAGLYYVVLRQSNQKSILPLVYCR